MKKTLLRILACLLVLLLPLSLFSCANRGETLLTLEVDGEAYTFPVNSYQLLLSRIKGMLISYGVTANGHKPSEEAFWSYTDKVDGVLRTNEEFYREQILQNCRTYLVAQYLFDRYELTLSEAVTDEIESDLNELILADGDGSKTKLNSILATYGVNYDMLEDLYIMEAKVDAVRTYLYSNLGTNIKTEYLEENYVHFRQIFLANYTYVYETDENGDTIYYNTTDDTVCYLKTEHTKLDSKGKLVYYTDSSYKHISYDTEKGEPSYKISSDGSGYETTPMTEAELEDLERRVEYLYSEMDEISAAEFEVAIKENSDDAEASAAYTDGYYLNKNLDYSASGSAYVYLDTIIDRLEDMDPGEIILVESASGYHIVMKYAHTEGAYDLEANEVWFSSFAADLSEAVLQEQCEPYYRQMITDAEILATVPEMKKIAINYYY